MSEQKSGSAIATRQGMRLREGAAYMGVSLSVFREHIHNGIVETYPVKVGSSHRRVTAEAIDEARARLRHLEIEDYKRKIERVTKSVVPEQVAPKKNIRELLKEINL